MKKSFGCILISLSSMHEFNADNNQILGTHNIHLVREGKGQKKQGLSFLKGPVVHQLGLGLSPIRVMQSLNKQLPASIWKDTRSETKMPLT